MQKRASSDIGRLLSVLFAALAGLYLLIGGIWLTAIGGSPYYVIAGVVMLVTAALLYRRRAIALGLYALLLLCTIVWGVWEAGFDFWALTPRLDVLVVFGIWLLLPFVYRTLDASGKPMALALGGTLVVSGLVLVYAAFNDPQQINGILSANAATSATPAASGTAADWPAYGRTQHGTRYSPLKQITADNVKDLQVLHVVRGDLLEGRVTGAVLGAAIGRPIASRAARGRGCRSRGIGAQRPVDFLWIVEGRINEHNAAENQCCAQCQRHGFSGGVESAVDKR